MLLRKLIVKAVLPAVLIFPVGCSIYKMDIRQGNYVTQEQVDKLKTGQSKEKVKAIMGTPTLRPVFNLDRWDYYYSLKPGQKDKHFEKKSLTLFFSNDKLVTYQGDWNIAGLKRH